MAPPSPGSGSARPAMGPDPVATHGSAGITPDSPANTLIDPRDSSRHAAVLASAALDRSLAHRAGRDIRSPMGRNQVDMAAAIRRQGFRQLCGNSWSTLRQLCVMGSGRESSDRSSVNHECFRPIGEAARSVAVQGLSGFRQLCGNSWSTLRQLCVKGRTRRSPQWTATTPTRPT